MFITVLRHAELDKAIALIGSVRGCYFILTRQELNAETAKEWGAVNEIVPADRLLTRARDALHLDRHQGRSLGLRP